MQTFTTILRAKPGQEDAVLAALLRIGAFVREHEPDTRGFFVAQDPEDPAHFTTFGRFTDRAAMDRHTAGEGARTFLAEAGDLLEGPVTAVTAVEVFAL